MNRFTQAVTAAFAFAAIGASGAQAQEQVDAHQAPWLTPDAEGRVTYDNFSEGFDTTGEYDRWDTDRDGMLSREEFNAGVYSRYDLDQDGVLNEDEMVGMGEDRMFFDEGSDQAQDEAQTNN